MAMSKKDYERIAGWMGAMQTGIERYGNAIFMGQFEGHFLPRVMDELAEDNPRFDRARFLKACGIGEE